ASLASPPRRYVLKGPEATAEFTCDAAPQRGAQGEVTLRQTLLKLTEERRSAAGERRPSTPWYRARSGKLEVQYKDSDRDEPFISVRLEDSLQTDRAPNENPETQLKKSTVPLPVLSVPAEVKRRIDEISDEQLLDRRFSLPLSAKPGEE